MGISFDIIVMGIRLFIGIMIIAALFHIWTIVSEYIIKFILRIIKIIFRRILRKRKSEGI